MRSLPVRKVVAGLASALTAGAVALALLNPGVVTQEVDLHDGGVWVTNQDLRLVGHLNYSSQVIDSGLRTESANFDLDQHAADVFVSDADADTYTQVDVATTVLGAPLASAAAMELGGDRVGLADPKTGKVWVTPAAEYGTFDATTAAPVIEDEPGVVMAMGVDGSVHAASAQTGHAITLTRAGRMEDRAVTELTGVEKGAKLEVSAVGDRTVVLDTATSTLHLPDGATARLSGKQLRLQEPGPDADEVLVASTSALLRVSMDGTVTTIDSRRAGGDPVRPVMHRDCAYGAWSGKGALVRDCADDERDVNEAADALDGADSLVFRVNRKVIVLNNMTDGGLWLPDEDMREVDNWDEISSQLEEKEKEDEDTTTDEATADQRTKENSPPQAVDDDFGVRPGRSAWLPVTWNDIDPDGDVLTVAALSQPSFGQVSVGSSGAGFQARVSPDASGSASFTYELSDGQATDQAEVRLTVHPWSVNEGPVQLRESSLVLGAEAKVSTNVSGDWIDPDGDPVFLQSVTGPQELSLSWRADGTVTVQDLGHPVGPVDLTVTYSDGQASTDGVLHVDVRGAGNIPPVANGDHVIIQEGQSTELDPRTNDSDANGDRLRVAALGEVPSGISAELDPVLSTVRVSGDRAGSYYLEYVVTDGPSSARGIIRVDVVAATTDAPPVAQDDVATLPAGGQVIIGVLDNDTDPAGGVLVVQSASVPAGSPLVVSVVDHHVLRVTAPGGLTDTQELTYTVANAAGTSEGRVLVIPAPAVSTAEPPVLVDDTLTVRVGDIASVSVLANDTSPAGLTMTVQDTVQHEIPADVAVPFVSGNRVRVRAGTKPGSGVLIYTVRDSAGNVASARVALSVVPMDEASNQAPRPREVTAWAVAGQKITVPIPLDGIDPDGDSVTLDGVVSSPRLGVAQMDETSLTYIPGATSNGTDVFSYSVRDRLGMAATATIRIGVAPAASTNQRPVAVADQVQVRPGMTVVVPVLDNDVDPDGDDLTLVAGSAHAQDKAVTVETVRAKIRVTAPEQEGTYVVEYGVTDSRSEPAAGLLTVVVAQSAPKRAPVARDDAVTVSQALEQTEVVVPVLDNDADPDGDIAEDTVSSQDSGVSVLGDGSLRIAVSPTERYVLYTVTDPDGLSSSAVVYVPGSEVVMPQIDPKAAAKLSVRAGEKVEIPLDRYVLTRDDRRARLTDAAKVSAAVGWDGSQLVKDKDTLVFGADPRYSGPSSITFEVTDAVSSTDTTAKTAMLTLPITVLPGDVNRPPTLRPTPIEVAAGEEAVSIDVSAWAEDPDEDDVKTMRYRLVQTTQGVQASLSGSTLRVSAPAGTARGQAGTLSIEATDSAHNQVTTVVPVTVVASRKPLIQVGPMQVTVHAGASETIDLSRYVTNPYPGSPVSVISATVVGGKVTAKVSGTELTVSAPEGTNGTATITVRLADQTGDPQREVNGTVEVTVLDRPAAPTAVAAVSEAASTASVSWKAGAANGDPITHFTVVDLTQGDSKNCGLVTVCLMEGRTNGKEHTFHVIATNGVGDSQPSPTATTMIDVVPGRVPPPRAVPGDSQVTVTWDAPANEGSPITGYTVTLSGPDSVKSETVKGTSAVFTGLTNGQSYTATVVATNAKGSSQEESLPSVAVTPYGRPGAPRDPQAQVVGVDGGTGTVAVSWSAADGNGRPVEKYVVSVNGQTAETGTTSTSLSLPVRTEPYTISITAVNDAASPAGHTSEPATVSVRVRGAVPVPHGSVEVHPTGNDGEFTLSGVQVVDGGGWSAAEQHLEWTVGDGQWHAVEAVNNAGTNGLVTVSVRAAVSGEGASEQISSSPVTLYGPPKMGSVTCQANSTTQVTCTWPRADGAGLSIEGYRISGRIDGIRNEGQESVVLTGLNPGETVVIEVRAVQKGGRVSEPQTGTATTPMPQARLVASSEPAGPEAYVIGGSGDASALKPRVELEGFTPGSTVQCAFRVSGEPIMRAAVTVGPDGKSSSVPSMWNVGGVSRPVGAPAGYNWGGVELSCS